MATKGKERAAPRRTRSRAGGPDSPVRTEAKPDAKAEPKSDIPLYRSIYAELLAEIRSGVYAPGDRLPSEAALCERFGASRITVAKAFQTLQRDRLVTRRPGSGTYVEHPTHEPSMQFGLLIPDLGSTEIFEPICQGMMRSPVARSHSLAWGHSVAGGCSSEQAAEQLCRQYIGQRVAGVFFAPMEYIDTRDAANRRIAGMLAGAKIPVVLLDRCFEPYPVRSPFDLVGIDNYRAGYLLAEHLLRAGATRILFAMRPGSAVTVEARIAGYREALRVARNPFSAVVCGGFEDPAHVSDILDRERPDGILCANDLTAAGLMQTLVTLGVRIPEQIRMAGVDDVSYARYLPVPLTTLRQDCAEIGVVAMSTMLERLEHPNRPVRDILVQCDLVIRASSGT